MSGNYTQVTDAFGNVSYVAVPTPIDSLHAVLSAAGAQVPTALAVPAVAAFTPDAINSVMGVAADVAMGNYVGAATTGIPLLLGAITALYAVFTPNQPQGVTDVQIQTAVAAMSRDQLISLLSQPAASPVPTAGKAV